MTEAKLHPASYKDPAGFVFEQDGIIFRHVNPLYAKAYEQLMASGLYKQLTGAKQLVVHEELKENISGSAAFYKTLLPEPIPFISYAYEWSFDMLKDAALLTLQICKQAIAHGMVLKDATPYNIQFVEGRPVFIDTLSFELYQATKPWIAYRQFCEEFLVPLLLSHYTGSDLGSLLLAYTDGIPVALCARLLPFRSRFNLLSLLHIHLQSGVQSNAQAAHATKSFSKQKFLHILDHLANGIGSLHAGAAKSTWSDYYVQTIKSKEYLEEKKAVFIRLLKQAPAGSALDLGANTGVFARLLAAHCKQVVACDFDSRAINQLYLDIKKEPGPILPLVIDISHPTPAIGWENKERASFLQRQQYDLVAALALIHHLVIGKNIPLQQLAACFYTLCKKFLLIEFVEREDEKVKILLERKELAYAHYTRRSFEEVFAHHFDLVTFHVLSDGLRVLYLWRKK